MANNSGIRVTPDDRGPAVNVITWLALVIICLSAISKVFSKFSDARSIFAPGSFTIVAAMFSAVVQTIAVSIQVKAGLGRRINTLDRADLVTFQKTEYLSQIFYIAVLLFAKFTTLFLLRTIANTPVRRKIVNGAGAITMLWATAALFGVMFQCPVPRTWEILSEHCFDQKAFWAAIGACDIATELVLSGVPVVILWDLQVPIGKKISIMSAFALRLLLIPLIIARVSYFARARDSSDAAFDEFDYVLTTQIELCVTVLVTCFPFLRMFMDHVHNGFFTGDLRQGPGPNVMNRSRGGRYGIGSIISHGKNSHSQESSGHSRGSGKKRNLSTLGTTTTVIGEDNGSAPSSRAGSDRMIIKETKTVSVEHGGIEMMDLEDSNHRGLK